MIPHTTPLARQDSFYSITGGHDGQMQIRKDCKFAGVRLSMVHMNKKHNPIATKSIGFILSLVIYK